MRFYSRTAFVNQFNFKNATAFFTNAFNRKPALNKEYSFNLFALVGIIAQVLARSCLSEIFFSSDTSFLSSDTSYRSSNIT